MGRILTPRVIGTPPARSRPKRLALIEIPSCPATEPICEDARPIDTRHLCGEIGNRRLRSWGHRIGLCQCFYLCQIRQVRTRLCTKRRDYVSVNDRSVRDAGVIPTARHRHRDAADTRQSCASLCKCFCRLAQKGVHRDRRCKRPSRGNSPSSRIASTDER